MGDASNDPQSPRPAAKAKTREERLAEQLRANLRRRKAAAKQDKKTTWTD